MMSQRYRVEKAIDPAIGRRMLSTCWLLAGLGIATLQMLLLAQAWSVSQRAFVPACMASAWVLGALLGMRLRADTRLWGSSLVLCALLWLGGSRLVSWQMIQTLLPLAVANLFALAALALLLGTISTAWLSQRRLWSPANERVMLARALVGITAGLFVVWVLPAWAGLVGLACVIPLLAFDFWSASRTPQPGETGVVDAWVGRYWRAEQRPLRLHTASVPRNWWWSYLVGRARESKGYVLLTLVASSTAVILGAVWGAVPTAFAAGLLETHELGKLGWLLGGQIAAFVIGVRWFSAARGVVGFPDRLLTPSWQSRGLSLGLLMPVVMGGSLVTLGLPFLQAPWWLALSLASYTLAGAVWGILLPRLRPSLGTVILAQRYLLLGKGMGLPDTRQLAYGCAQEEHVTRLLSTTEGMLIAVITPVVGWLIDLLASVDATLITVGTCVVLVLACSLFAFGLLRRRQHVRFQLYRTPMAYRYAPATYRASARGIPGVLLTR
jgi:hypothetical protein